ncbi:MAG: sigma-70 family RNA polymerase sigma factor [Ruminiclostridium sp.]|nr:sigma-70 family RNA polymerase sigma factor [Ruminiclostridium sp.]
MNRQTLDDIYRTHMQDIYRYLLSLCHNHHVAEDILQETFYRAYLHLEDCREERVKPWLFRVAHNVFVDFTRKQKRIHIREDAFFSDMTTGRTTEEEVMTREYIREVGGFIATLTENQRQAILLCDFHDLSYREASEIMGVGLNHIKILLFRARQSLRKWKEREKQNE